MGGMMATFMRAWGTVLLVLAIGGLILDGCS